MEMTLAQVLPCLARNELSEVSIIGDISDFAAKHLRRAIEKCTSLAVVHLCGTHLTSAAMGDFCKVST